MNILSIGFRDIVYFPVQVVLFTGSCIDYILAQLYAGVHIYLADSVKGQEISLLSRVIHHLNCDQVNDRLIEELKQLLNDPSETKPYKGAFDQDAKNTLVTVLKTHRYSLYRLFRGVQANRYLALPIYAFIAKAVNHHASTTEKYNFSKLPITENQKQAIAELLPILANTDVATLRGMQDHLEDLGQRLSQLHPLRFLGEALSQPSYREMLRKIKESSLKWKGVWLIADGFVVKTAKELAKCHEEVNLQHYLPTFCTHLTISQEKFAPYVQNGQWQPFIDALVTHDYT
jgi:hypothetical protein